MVRAETTDQRIMLLKILQVHIFSCSVLVFHVDYILTKTSKVASFGNECSCLCNHSVDLASVTAWQSGILFLFSKKKRNKLARQSNLLIQNGLGQVSTQDNALEFM